MSAHAAILSDILTYISPLFLIALFFFCFCRFLTRPCIPRRSSTIDDDDPMVYISGISPAGNLRRERNPRLSFTATSRVQPTAQLPPIHVISGDFPEILTVRCVDDPPKYEDAIKLEDAAPPAYTPNTISSEYEHSTTAVSETRPETIVSESTVISTQDQPQSSRTIRRTYSLPNTSQSNSSTSQQASKTSNAQFVLSVENFSDETNRHK